MSRQIVVLDTNVLYSMVARQLFLRLAKENICYPHWSPSILNELNHCGLPERDYAKALDELKSYPPGLVRNSSTAMVGLPDPADEHVYALAQATQATVIVTYNKADFPHELCGEINILTPDEFFCSLHTECPQEFTAVLRQHCGSEDWNDYLEKLGRARLHKLGRALKELLF